jgi:hypothetical protein
MRTGPTPMGGSVAIEPTESDGSGFFFGIA